MTADAVATMPRVTEYKVIKINVTPAAKQVIEDIAGEHGMKEVVLASKVYEWFGAQDDVTRKAILGMLPKGFEVDVARLALERIAGRGKGKK